MRLDNSYTYCAYFVWVPIIPILRYGMRLHAIILCMCSTNLCGIPLAYR